MSAPTAGTPLGLIEREEPLLGAAVTGLFFAGLGATLPVAAETMAAAPAVRGFSGPPSAKVIRAGPALTVCFATLGIEIPFFLASASLIWELSPPALRRSYID